MFTYTVTLPIKINHACRCIYHTWILWVMLDQCLKGSLSGSNSELSLAFQPIFRKLMVPIFHLNSSPLKNSGGKTTFQLGRPISRGYVKLQGCNDPTNIILLNTNLLISFRALSRLTKQKTTRTLAVCARCFWMYPIGSMVQVPTFGLNILQIVDKYTSLIDPTYIYICIYIYSRQPIVITGSATRDRTHHLLGAIRSVIMIIQASQVDDLASGPVPSSCLSIWCWLVYTPTRC